MGRDVHTGSLLSLYFLMKIPAMSDVGQPIPSCNLMDPVYRLWGFQDFTGNRFRQTCRFLKTNENRIDAGVAVSLSGHIMSGGKSYVILFIPHYNLHIDK